MPKDGPSAGIGMVTAIISTLTGIPVRRDVAMTGEVTLRGRVLPIGGLKEKLLAALRGGITKVLIPAENEKDLAEIPANIRDGLEIVPVSHVDEVLAHALATPVVPIDWTEADELAALPAAGARRRARRSRPELRSGTDPAPLGTLPPLRAMRHVALPHRNDGAFPAHRRSFLLTRVSAPVFRWTSASAAIHWVTGVRER